MNQKTKQESKPGEKPTTELPPALKRAHEALREKAKARAALTDDQRAKQDVKKAVNAAAERLYTGRASLASTLERNRGKLSAEERQKVVKYLEQIMELVHEAAVGKSGTKDTFDL